MVEFGLERVAYIISAALFMAGYLAREATTWQGVFILVTAGLLVLMMTNNDQPDLEAISEADLDIE